MSALPLDPDAPEDAFNENFELEALRSSRRHPAADATASARPYVTIGILGGGTAGYLTALALREQLPRLKITIIESKDIPIIGVGEATGPNIVPFLHSFCKIDIQDFYKKVKPTWKQGIRFEWGPSDHFQAPFDWDRNNLGFLGSLEEEGNINSMTLQAVMMESSVTPIAKRDGRCVSYLKYLPVAYHLDNVGFVSYLQELARSRGIVHLDRTVVDATLAEDGESVRFLETKEGEKLSFDLYFDCSGFRSFLLEKKLGSKYISYSDSLFCDRAVTFSTPLDSQGPRPYTTATTMQAGWTWTIPHRDRNNHGYVHSSEFLDLGEAEREIRSRWPEADELGKVIPFRSGRHEMAWKGNVVGLGNAYAFVEPLESSAIIMLSKTIEFLISVFPASQDDSSARSLLNAFAARRWDGLRWFLAIHYKFNRRIDSAFWRHALSDVDVSGGQVILDAYRELAPLTLRNHNARFLLESSLGTVFFGLPGWDTLLLGQKVSCRLAATAEAPEAWKRRRRIAGAFSRDCLRQDEALAMVDKHPEWLTEMFTNEEGWVRGENSATLDGLY